MADTAAECPLPADVCHDALESYLLLSCLATLWGQQEGRWLPSNYSVRSRNDLVQAAKGLLEASRFQIFLQYSEAPLRQCPLLRSMLALDTAGQSCWLNRFFSRGTVLCGRLSDRLWVCYNMSGHGTLL